MRSTETLHDGWTLQAIGNESVPATVAGAMVPATVPGCVHTDLLAAGLIPDPYLDDNELAVAWVGRTGWRYTTTVDWRPDGAERNELLFEGLDTVATVSLNGKVLGRSINMHRSYRYDVTGRLRAGGNELVVDFGSAWTQALAERERLGARPSAYGNAPFNFVRKMACSFGWDWGPSTVTAGIWRPVTLQSWSVARLERVRPVVDVDGTTGRVQVHVDVDRASPVPLVLEGVVTGHGATARGSVVVPAGATTAVLELEVGGVRRWWPHGYGEQPLYELTVDLRDDACTGLDAWRRRIGFRRVRLDTTPDADGAGSAFTFVVNDRPVFAYGVNWIPDDVFPSRIDRDRYHRRLSQGRDANVNLVRVWGGGIYESDDFYDVCDELGILVWQDFLFACAAYPEEEPFASEVEAEAREAVARLMPHPSLVLWNGNNENIWGWFDWDWQAPLGDRTWGKGYYLDVLPRVVAETDPSRPYWPGSPYSGTFDVHPNDDAAGPKHVWDVWNERDYTGYRDYTPRFVAEFGFQAPPAWSTLVRAVHDHPIAPDSPGVLHHQKASDGNGKLARGLEPHFAAPVTVEDWHFLTQVNQARAVTVGIEWFRSLRPRCMGTVWWQLNDCWPVTSWAVVDGDGALKPAWYALRRAYAPRLLTIQPRAGRPVVVLVNDTLDAWESTVDVGRYSFAGQRLAGTTVEVRVDPYTATEVPLPNDVASPEKPTRELVCAVADGHRATWWFVEDRDAALPPASLDAEVRAAPGGYLVRIAARTLVRDLCLFADRLDPGARVAEMLLTLLPGEEVELRVEATDIADPQALLTPPVLRYVNDVGVSRGDPAETS